MIIKQTSIIAMIAIIAVTFLGIIALTVNTDSKLDINLGNKDLGVIEIELQAHDMKTHEQFYSEHGFVSTENSQK